MAEAGAAPASALSDTTSAAARVAGSALRRRR
jgi:hypothetical protein